MTWLSRALCLALATSACGGAGGTSADESSTSTPATTTATGTTSTTTVTGGATSTDGTGGASGGATSTGPNPTTGAPSTTTTGDPTSTGPASTTSSGSSGEVTASSSGGETTGGPAGVCKNVAGDYGDCEAEIGWGFDGTTCKSFSGCDCAPNCDGFFPGPVACASACAAAGECREEVVDAAALAMDPVGPGSFCDEVDACVETPELQAWLQELFPGQACEPDGFPCSGDNCHLQFAGRIGPDAWQQICAATLLPGLEQIYCVVFGP